MLRISKWCFLSVAVMESAMILWDCGGPEVMVSELYSLEDMRFGLVLSSLVFSCVCDLLDA